MNTIVYQVGEKLYINLTNRCSNNCDFCIRYVGESAYNSGCLWLKEEPTASQVIAALKANDKFNDASEVVFCGYGEPTYRINEIEEIGEFLKKNKKRVRINTNGQGNLINGMDITDKLKNGVDIVNVSLNADTKENYQNLCNSIYGEDAFLELQNFAKLCKDKGMEVVMSVVDVISNEQIENCRKIAMQCGVGYRVRKYD